MSDYTIERAGAADVPGLVELTRLRPPATWTTSVPDETLARFLAHAVRSSRSAVLVARAPEEDLPAAYIFATLHPRRFWLDFAFRRPLDARRIFAGRVRRVLRLRREAEVRAAGRDDLSGLPGFSWSPSDPGIARMVAVFVRDEHRRRGLASDLYRGLFAELKSRGAYRLEAYMGPDYPDHAGRLAERLGWTSERWRCGGYKTVREL